MPSTCVRRDYDLIQLELCDVQEANQQGQKGNFCFAISLLLRSKRGIKNPPKIRSQIFFFLPFEEES